VPSDPPAKIGVVMIGALVAFCFFAFATVAQLVEARNLWRMPADEILALPGGGSAPGLTRRMRIALPAGIALCIPFDLIGLAALAELFGFQAPGFVYAVALLLLGVVGVLAAAAVWLRHPQALLLPAFRKPVGARS
jgi:hypothetical protein